MKKIKLSIVTFLLSVVRLLTPKPEVIHSLNKQDMLLIEKAFPPFIYRKGMTTEEIALETIRCHGEQKVVSYLLARIQGRIGAGVLHG